MKNRTGDFSLGAVIPAFNAADSLGITLESLEEGLNILDMDVLVVDGGSVDETVHVAQKYQARVIEVDGPRGVQLARAVDTVLGGWILLLDAGTRLQAGWPRVIAPFVKHPMAPQFVGYGRYRLHGRSLRCRRMERFAAWRAQRLGLPGLEQGVIAHRHLFSVDQKIQNSQVLNDMGLVRLSRGRNLVPLPFDAVVDAGQILAGQSCGVGRMELLRLAGCLMRQTLLPSRYPLGG